MFTILEGGGHQMGVIGESFMAQGRSPIALDKLSWLALPIHNSPSTLTRKVVLRSPRNATFCISRVFD